MIISVPLPPSTNHLYRSSANGKRHLTKEARAYKKEVQKEMMVNGVKGKCPEPPFSLHLHVRFPDRRRRDASNAVKVLEDAVFEYLGYDDSLVLDLHVWKFIDREDPGVTVEVRHSSRKLDHEEEGESATDG